VEEARAALTKLGWLDRGDCEMSIYQDNKKTLEHPRVLKAE
jgi:hypothetical protein